MSASRNWRGRPRISTRLEPHPRSFPVASKATRLGHFVHLLTNEYLAVRRDSGRIPHPYWALIRVTSDLHLGIHTGWIPSSTLEHYNITALVIALSDQWTSYLERFFRAALALTELSIDPVDEDWDSN